MTTTEKKLLIAMARVDVCGCYSEYTTESCRLDGEFTDVTFDFPITDDRMYNLIGDLVRPWTERNLSWHGCECCDNYLHSSEEGAEMTTRDFIPNDDQHCCTACGWTCDCGAMCSTVLPDGFADECLGCLDCIDSQIAQDTEFRAARAAAR